MSRPVTWRKDDGLAVVTIDNPPVNALSMAVRQGLLDVFRQIRDDPATHAVALLCAGRTFVAGADIREFSEGDPVAVDPNGIFDLIEHLGKPVLATIHGTALGGGFELALASHYRIALANARVGLPEITLGLVPGAGGTQRSVRLMGVRPALELMLSGTPIAAPEAMKKGLIDEIVEGDLLAAAKAFFSRLPAGGEATRRASERPIGDAETALADIESARQELLGKSRAPLAAARIVDCVSAAVSQSFAQGLEFERHQFLASVRSPESAALRHIFFAEREAARIPGLPEGVQKHPVAKVGVIGAGTMGGGIAMNFINVGIPVVLIDMGQEALDRGLGIIRRNYETTLAKGKLTREQLDARMALLTGALQYGDVADCDLVIEAVFENMSIKKEVLGKLGGLCKPDAIIATNTSSLDVDELALATGRPQDVLGMHFFSPANVMRLLEVVRGRQTSPAALATVMALAKRIGKVAVVSGVCYGFIGNRMLEGYLREAELLLMEGATPAQVDQALEAFGMAMGPHRMMDLAGVDVGAKVLIERGKAGGLPADPAYRSVIQTLHQLGRNGQKAGVGYYRYEGRKAVSDPVVDDICAGLAARYGIARRSDIAAGEIVRRCLYPLINEGAKTLEEGIAYRASDIDVVWTSGYGFPARLGGPMHQADVIGLAAILEGMAVFARRYGNQYGYWEPAALLQKLAASGQRFADY
ncbi:MAG: enoyl-CoA hydratase/isomerase family protein [Azonexus sp.]|jgi:3-hydroxyacyl-CoA dehydrogenase|nr:enoyl-CoA hydratase/isomerase family protein [Azonexus sp.]